MWLVIGAWCTIIVALYVGGILVALLEGVTALATLGGRIELAAATYHLLLEHPVNALVGGGLAYWPQYVAEWSLWQWVDAHNVYLNQVLEFGLVGLAFFVGFLVLLLRESLRMRNVDVVARYSYVGALFAMTGSYCFEPSFATPSQKFQLLFVAALLAGTNRVTSDTRKDAVTPRAVLNS